MEYGIYVGIASLFLALVGHAVKVTWQVRDLEAGIRADMNAEVDNVQRDITRLERAGADRGESLRHEFGETGNALRTKIHEVETWNRDTFVRKDSFEMVIGRLEKSLDKLGDKIEDRIEKLIERIESKN